MSLRTDTDLKALSKTPAPGDAARMMTYAELSVTRMQDSRSPMPPGGPTSTQATDIAAIQNWINAGYPSGSCGGVDAGVVVYPTVCTSGTYTIGEDISDKNLMHPGGACNTCHATQREKPPIFSIAGTVYSTYHEKNDCNAASSVRGTQVIITGADGRTMTLTVGTTGNVHSEQKVALPFQAKVVQNGNERVMQAAQMVGDCNSCHTEQGTSGAPGRILAP